MVTTQNGTARDKSLYAAVVCPFFSGQDSIWIPLARYRLPGILRGRRRIPRVSGENGPYPMKIHEYQAKKILAKYGVAVPRGEVANTLEEASTVARKLFTEGASGVVVKAQIHAGGRGKGGGVKVARTQEEAELYAKNILGMTLVTHQTGPLGQKVQRLLIEETAAIDRELYLGIVLDRVTGKLVFMASQAGGMEIEVVAAKTPEAIFKESIDPVIGLGSWQARKLAFALATFAKNRIVCRFYRHELIEEIFPRDVWTWNEFKGRKQTNEEAPEVLLTKNMTTGF